MGEAKRKREARVEAMATGQPVPRPTSCPKCGSHAPIGFRVIAGIEYGACGKCGACWEAFPALYVEDPVCAEPCDNCAFRPGSPEQEDPEKWKELIASLKPDPDTGLSSGKFFCHKNMPIKGMVDGKPEFDFPQKPAGKEPPLDQVMVPDVANMRVCSGFLRMFWAQRDKLRPHPLAEADDAV